MVVDNYLQMNDSSLHCTPDEVHARAVATLLGGVLRMGVGLLGWAEGWLRHPQGALSRCSHGRVRHPARLGLCDLPPQAWIYPGRAAPDHDK